jgi:membrane protein DedA with SNARE-associated domain
MVETFDSWIHQVGPAAYLLLFLAALIEYVFPPFPGDTLVLLGGVYAVRGEKPLWLVFVAITLGSVVGSMVDYWMGKRLALRIERHPTSRGWGVTAQKLHEMQERMRHRGTWLLVVNRFLPAVRALIFMAAGASGLPFKRTVLLGALSACGWNALLMGVGFAVGGNADALEVWVRRYYRGAWLVLAVVAVAWLLRTWWKRRRPAAAPLA